MAASAHTASGRLRAFLARQPPLVKASLTSGAIMMVGDIMAQQITAPTGRSRRVDWKRTVRFGVVGATLHGPYFFKGMGFIDRKFGPQKSLQNAAKKMLTAQAVLFPPFIALLFGWVGILEGKSPKECIQKVKDNYRQAFLFGSVFWPTANIINFRFVSQHQRVLYVSSAGLVWNTFISWVNANKRSGPEALKTT